LRPGNGTAYEEDIEVPFTVRGPGVPAGKRLHPMVLNVDLAPTFAGIAGVEPPDEPKQPWRQSFMIGRLELDAREQDERSEPVRFKAIRTSRWSYAEYAGDDGRGLYDLERDPCQLWNLAQAAEPAFVQALRRDYPSSPDAKQPRRSLENLSIAK
jgi:N-acetylglucosamine-6-sulfatase